MFVLAIVFVYFLLVVVSSVVSTSAIDCWQSLVSELCWSAMLNCIHSPTKHHDLLLYTSGSQSPLKDRFLYMYILVLQGVVLMQALKFEVSELFERVSYYKC